jgi:hypothetical protein
LIDLNAKQPNPDLKEWNNNFLSGSLYRHHHPQTPEKHALLDQNSQKKISSKSQNHAVLAQTPSAPAMNAFC